MIELSEALHVFGARNLEDRALQVMPLGGRSPVSFRHHADLERILGDLFVTPEVSSPSIVRHREAS